MAEIGLGLAALGRPGYINLGHHQDLAGRQAVADLERHTYHMLDRALALGIRYVDAARSYGRSEVFLSNWIGQRSDLPSDFRVGSKWGYTYTADWQIQAEVHEVKEHSLANFVRQWGLSQKLLPFLKLYQVHSATLDSGILDQPELHRAMAALKEKGISVGLSLSGTKQSETLLKALEIQVDGEPLFSSVQATFNVFERSVAPALQLAHAAGWQIIIKEALANGRLTNRNNRMEDHQQIQALRSLASAHQTSLDALALGFVLAQPWVDIVLSGAAQLTHLESNLRAYDLVEQADWQAPLWMDLAEKPGLYWAIRKSLTWN
ncbi:MAG: aldo/keto reductase [Bacteroidota bacterium]